MGEFKLSDSPIDGGLIEEIGVCVRIKADRGKGVTAAVLLDHLYADGTPCYSIRMEQEQEELWTIVHREISQFTRLKGLCYLEEEICICPAVISAKSIPENMTLKITGQNLPLLL